MSKPNYRVTLSFDGERKLFVARAPELEHCFAEGATRAEAIAKLEEEIDAQLANMLSHGSAPPRSVDEETFSGEITARISKSLHRELAYMARAEGLDLDQVVSEILAAGVEQRRSGARGGARRAEDGNRAPGNHYDGGGRGRGFNGNPRTTQLLDDRATFIEYVRGLENGGGQGGFNGRGNHGGYGGGQRNNNRHGGGRGGRGHGGHDRGGRNGQHGQGGGRGPHHQHGQNNHQNNHQNANNAAPPSPPEAHSGDDDTNA
jgi:predicted HicB family RNase H-like nuclease